MPTPSQPKKRTIKFPAEVRIIIAKRKIRRCLENESIFGSLAMYQEENSRIHHDTNKAIVKKMI